jgi:hypothetical protein
MNFMAYVLQLSSNVVGIAGEFLQFGVVVRSMRSVDIVQEIYRSV